MDYSINTRPLLDQSETETNSENDDYNEDMDQHAVVTRDIKPLFKMSEPDDKFNVVYLIFYLLGTVVLLPWFFFINALDYWKYKLRPLNVTEVDPVWYTVFLGTGEQKRTNLEEDFISYLSIASTVPSLIFLVVNTFLASRISIGIRLVGSLVAMLVLFVVTTAFVKIDTDKWQDTFFFMTLGIVVLLNIASSIMQGALFGLVGQFPSRFIAASVSGQALGGVFAAISCLVSLYNTASPVNSAFVYFIIADVCIFASIIAYFYLTKTTFYRYYLKQSALLASARYEPVAVNTSNTYNPTTSPITVHIDIMGIFKKVWVHGLSVCLCFLVSLSLYPAVTAYVKSTSKETNEWTEIYFAPVIAYFAFSVCDYGGRLIAGYWQWPRKNSWIVLLISISRIAFIPLILFCNAQPRSHLPVLIQSDLIFVLLVILMGLSNGYLANITFICAAKMVEPHEQEVASAIMVLSLGVGLACGSTLSLLKDDIL